MCVFWGEQEPRHLQYVADLEDLNVYTVVNSRKLYGAPADFTFCIKVTTSSAHKAEKCPQTRQQTEHRAGNSQRAV